MTSWPRPGNKRKGGTMKSTTQRPRMRLARAACFLLIFALAWSSPAQARTFGGRAFAAYVNVPSLGAGPLYLADTGQLLPSGGWQSADLLGAQVPNALSGEVLNSAAVGGDIDASSSSLTSLANVTVLPGSVAQLTASFVQSAASASSAGSGGSTQIYDLTFGGVHVEVTGAPNQRVQIPGAPILGLLGQVIGTGAPLATLIINEQTVTSDATSQAITVNALHLILATGEEVILASASSLVDSAGQGNLADGRSRAHPAGEAGGAHAHAAPAREVALADARAPGTPLGTVMLASLSALGQPAAKSILASARNGLTAPVVPAIATRSRSGSYCPANTNPAKNLLWKLVARPPIILAQQQQQCSDFVTGGGFFLGSSDGSGRVTFGFNAGFKNGTNVPLMAHLNLVDDNSGRHVKIESADSYGPGGILFKDPCHCRFFRGSGTSDGTPVDYEVDVCDFGEPGNAPNGVDKFAIGITDPATGNTYIAVGDSITGGNIKLHKACPQAGC